jgi:hypothetical protein
MTYKDMTTEEKIQTILRDDLTYWQKMTHDQLISQLIEKRRYDLRTEVEYGNEDYLDELLEDIDIAAVWSIQHPEEA